MEVRCSVFGVQFQERFPVLPLPRAHRTVECMGTPLEFLYHFRGLLQERGIRFAITSGMACVYYGLQQTTKDSDWIIEPADLPKLHALLMDHERRVPPWRISYRQIFGAPMNTEYLAQGWTSHLSIWPSAGGEEEHVDIFGAAPRVQPGTVQPDSMGFASPDLVAWMKRTDRDKDWPIVDGLGHLLQRTANPDAVMHLQSVPRLRAVWSTFDAGARAHAVLHRPLLSLLEATPNDEVMHGLIALERTVWETVNQERYRLFQHEWKEFYRRWKKEEFWEWPTAESFAQQHERVLSAARRYELPIQILDEAGKEAAWHRGIARTVLRSGRLEALVLAVTPPRKRMLP